MMCALRHRPVRWRFLGLCLLLGLAGLNAPAQTPTFNKFSDINVGGLVPGASAGTATLNSPSGTRSSSGATTLGSSVGLSLGSLTLSGRPGDAWTITGASAIPFTLSGPGGTLQVTAVDFEPSTTNAGTFPASGTTPNFYLGVSVNVGTAAATPPGSYTGSVSLRLTDTTNGRTSTQAFTVTVRIDAVITLARLTNLSFGDIYTTPASGTVVLSPAGVRTFTGGVLLGGLTAVTAASFTVTGTASTTYAITLPVSVVLTGPGGTMTANAFTSTPSATGTLSTAGQQQLRVGATLNVGANQPSGNYSGTFSVTVAYN